MLNGKILLNELRFIENEKAELLRITDLVCSGESGTDGHHGGQ